MIDTLQQSAKHRITQNLGVDDPKRVVRQCGPEQSGIEKRLVIGDVNEFRRACRGPLDLEVVEDFE